MTGKMLPSQQVIADAVLRTMPKEATDDEPAREHVVDKRNRAQKRASKHLYKKLNKRKGFRHGQG
jgi:hypothetical protein